MKCGNTLGAAAVTRLVELKGVSIKGELLRSFVEARDDYNYCCNGVASALQPFASPDDIQKIVALADSIEDEIPPGAPDEVAQGFTCGAAEFLSGLDVTAIREAFLPEDEAEPLSEVRARVLCNILRHNHSTDALDLAADLLVRGVDRAATAIYFISKFAKPDESLAWTRFSRDHVDHLVSKFNDETDNSWNLKALTCICDARPDLVEVVRDHASTASGIAKAALIHCASSGDTTPVFGALAELAGMGLGQRGLQCTHLLDQIDLNWAGHERLFVQLLRLRERRLALALLDEVYMDRTLGECAIGPIDWWLEWLSEERSTESGYWFCYRMAYVFGRVLSTGDRQAFVAEFNRPASPFRSLLAHCVLPHFPDLTTDVFGADAISFLLADLNREGSADEFGGHLLGTATEQFVTERLLPLVAGAKPPLSENLRKVLRQAGSRHGRRYVRT